MKRTHHTQTFTRRQVLGIFAAGATGLAAPTLAKIFTDGNRDQSAHPLQSAHAETSRMQSFVLSF